MKSIVVRYAISITSMKSNEESGMTLNDYSYFNLTLQLLLCFYLMVSIQKKSGISLIAKHGSRISLKGSNNCKRNLAIDVGYACRDFKIFTNLLFHIN